MGLRLSPGLRHLVALLAASAFAVPLSMTSGVTPAEGATPAAAAPGAVAQQRLALAPQTKVTICHRTNSRTNPYNQIVVSQSAAISGHADHTGPIFGPGVDTWGDIIAPIRPGLPAGRNWPEGRAILANGCELQPDVGPLPTASIGDLACAGTVPSLDITVTNALEATAPASFTIVVDGAEVETVGPVAPGESETVSLGGAPGGGLDGLEDQTFTVEVRSGDEVLASRVITVDCSPEVPPAPEIDARLVCAGAAAQGTASVTNNATVSVEVTVTVDGSPVGNALVVDPGASATGTVDLSPFEDQTITVRILLDGALAATYVVTPDCVPPQPSARVSVAGQVCPPPTTTVTLANDGDPASRVVFVIRLNGRVVQESAPLYGGDVTTIVGDLSRFEDQTVLVAVRANGELLGRRAVTVNCGRPAPDPGPDTGPGTNPPPATHDVLPDVGTGLSIGVLALALGLLVSGPLLLVSGRTPLSRLPRVRRPNGSR
ncbi:exported hypothetical protein [metagenome]|uniref:Uncharacterized protein n=1 Tax=metagenome TaxID=256318 RepID=A0A2P2CB49_9ZZZZ